MRPTRTSTALTVAALLAVPVLAACGGETSTTMAPTAAANLQAIVDGAVANPATSFPGAALYVRDPKRGTWSGAAGEAIVTPSTPMRADDRFRAGSIVKPFVATAILQLSEEGLVDLDAPITRMLPPDIADRVDRANDITVRMLLNHTSGIPEYTDADFDRRVVADPHHVFAVGELLDLSAAHPRAFAPGARYAYSNTDYNMLGLVIEQATGRPWRAVVRERVIDRAGLEHTTLPEPGHSVVADLDAHGYEPIDGTLKDLTDVDPSMAGAAGGHALVTTTADLTRFLDALLDARLFTQRRTLDAMLKFVASDDLPGKVGYGLGIERYVFPDGSEVIGHFGGTAGFRAFVGRVTATKADVAMVINDSDDPTPVLLPAVAFASGQATREAVEGCHRARPRMVGRRLVRSERCGARV